jgi:lipopolysaccharide export system permease protein
MLPMAALIGCLIGLGSLASHSELTIMRSAGVSVGRIVWSVMKPMLVLMLAGVLIGEYVAPATENQAQAARSLAQGGGEAQTSKRGVWHRQGDEYVHINSVQPNGVLYGVTRYRFDGERHLLTSSFTRMAQYETDHWALTDVTTTHFRGDSTEVIKAPEERWDVALTPELLSTVVVAPESLSISGLWTYINYLSEQGLNNDRYWLAFWTKVLQPLVTSALVLMAISFIFGPLRSVTLGQRVFTGVLVGFVFRIVQDLLGPSSQVFGFSPLLAVAVPAGVCALVGVWLLRRAG